MLLAKTDPLMSLVAFFSVQIPIEINYILLEPFKTCGS